MDTEGSEVETAVDLYANVWKLFRERPFEPSTLAKRLIERDEYELVAAEGEPAATLDGLVDYGLLERTGGEYRIVVGPDEVADEWRDTEALRTDAVDRLVRSALVRTEGSDETLTHDGGKYAVVELASEVSVTEGLERVVEAAADHDGVVVATPGTNADSAQRIADRLAERDGQRWEKSGTDVVEGDDPDSELVFRLFLDG